MSSQTHSTLTEADESLTTARATNDPIKIAYVLRHTAAAASKVGAHKRAANEIEEAIAIYRERAETNTLNLANALRVSALNYERAALAAWTEAKDLYSTVDVQAGVDGATKHIQQLSDILGGIS